VQFLSKRFFLLWLAVICFMAACSCQQSIPQLNVHSALDARLLQQGDAEFVKMHWNGWEKAARYYQETLVQRDDQNVRQRLFSAYILLSLRETELSIRNESWLQKAESLLPKVTAAPFSAQLALAREKMRQISLFRGGYTTQGAPELEKTPIDRDYSSALSNYLYLIYLRLITTRDTTAEYIEAEKQFQRLHGNSNLAIFFRSYTLSEMDENLAAFPDFAEMYMLRGDWYRAEKNYQAALADYQQAVGRMPVLFKARNAMATLWYSLEDYEQALFHYEKTLEICPLEPAAMFGRAICLSELRRFDESDQALREMIAKQTFFHGEAFYYLAKNCYYRQRPDEVRNYIKQAAAFIPDSPDLNMLSGLLYLDRGQPGQAAVDFRKVLEQQPQHAEAGYFLGQAALQEKKYPESRINFQAAIENFDREIKKFDDKLAVMSREQNTDPHQRAYFLKSRRQRAGYVIELRERLTGLQKKFAKTPLPALRELLNYLADLPAEK
jgi:tetratricopeptide (TPR) repeat protein